MTRETAHPSPGEILELHFGEAGPAAAKTAAHVAGCEECRRERDAVAWAESVLAVDAEPPADGLERVLAEIAAAPPPAPARRPWVRAAAPSAAAIAAGAVAIRLLGERVLTARIVPETALAPAAALSGFGLAALLFFAAGSLVTLTVAPFLILEAKGLRGASR